MKTIKFRAWDLKEKKFDTFDHYQDFATFHYYPETPNIIEGKPMNKDLILQQFTGLKDKNGKDIYFGDIVKYKDDSNKEQIGIVKDYGYFSGYVEAIGGDEEGNQDLQLHDAYEFEIIGNIYENHELLK